MLRPSPEDWLKFNVDASKRHHMRLATIGCIIRDNWSNAIWLRTRNFETAQSSLSKVKQCAKQFSWQFGEVFHGLSFRVTLS